jgi:single-stranded DNA-binding protein
MNSVVLVGTVTRTPIVRFEGAGLQVTTLTLALAESGREGKGYTLYVPCQAWGRAAEACSLLEAETLVAVQGKLSWRKQTGKCGTDHSTLIVRIGEVQLLRGAEVPV